MFFILVAPRHCLYLCAGMHTVPAGFSKSDSLNPKSYDNEGPFILLAWSCLGLAWSVSGLKL